MFRVKTYFGSNRGRCLLGKTLGCCWENLFALGKTHKFLGKPIFGHNRGRYLLGKTHSCYWENLKIVGV